ncbi:MAG: hopanoid biosynthesis-associated protein HpnK [Verrucomicrobia bacterium]|nr:hopanoid biosynthesis-associated protein HpnK [Verrucomicrobiota bacterium]
MNTEAPQVRTARRLVVNADDFGRSSSINEAVQQAHTRGILTTASLMVNEPAAADAVRRAHEHPSLGVGLHLTLLLGRAALPAHRIPGLIQPNGGFRSGPVAAGLRFFFLRSLREQLRAELHEQFRRFRETGLVLDHVNGHLHLHLHPVVLDLLMQDAAVLGCTRVRLTHDPLGLNLAIARGHLAYRFSHALIYRVLSARARRAFARQGIRHTRQVFGLLQNARVDEAYVLRLLPRLPPGDSELYSHPSLEDFRHELEALVSPAVGQAVQQLGLHLIRYQDL